MSGQTTGGVFIAFLGVVLIIAGINGTLGRTWSALLGQSTGAKASNPNSSGAQKNNPGDLPHYGLPGTTATTTAGQIGSGLTV